MNLYWTNTDSETCPVCGGLETNELEVDLTAHFEKSVKSRELKKDKTLLADFHLLQCESCGAWRCELVELEAWLTEFDLEQVGVERFTVEKTVTTTSVALQGGSGAWKIQSWAEHIEFLSLEKKRQSAPVPSVSEVLAIPQAETEEWLLAVLPLDYVHEGFSTTNLVYIAVLFDSSGLLRASQMQPKLFTEQELESFLLRACANPSQGPVALRPKALRMPDAELIGSMQGFLSSLQIPVMLVPPEIEDQIYQDFAKHGGREVQEFFFFKDVPEAQIREFTKNAKRFFSVAPWEFTSPDDCLAFKLPNSDWQYATVMGHMSESFGLAMFPSWLAYCQFIHNQRGRKPMGFDLAKP